MRGSSKPPVVETTSKAEDAAGADVVPITAFAENVAVLALIGASALSSPRRTARPLPTRLMAGLEELATLKTNMVGRYRAFAADRVK